MNELIFSNQSSLPNTNIVLSLELKKRVHKNKPESLDRIILRNSVNSTLLERKIKLIKSYFYVCKLTKSKKGADLTRLTRKLALDKMISSRTQINQFNNKMINIMQTRQSHYLAKNNKKLLHKKKIKKFFHVMLSFPSLVCYAFVLIVIPGKLYILFGLKCFGLYYLCPIVSCLSAIVIYYAREHSQGNIINYKKLAFVVVFSLSMGLVVYIINYNNYLLPEMLATFIIFFYSCINNFPSQLWVIREQISTGIIYYLSKSFESFICEVSKLFTKLVKIIKSISSIFGPECMPMNGSSYLIEKEKNYPYSVKPLSCKMNEANNSNSGPSNAENSLNSNTDNSSYKARQKQRREFFRKKNEKYIPTRNKTNEELMEYIDKKSNIAIDKAEKILNAPPIKTVDVNALPQTLEETLQKINKCKSLQSRIKRDVKFVELKTNFLKEVNLSSQGESNKLEIEKKTTFYQPPKNIFANSLFFKNAHNEQVKIMQVKLNYDNYINHGNLSEEQKSFLLSKKERLDKLSDELGDNAFRHEVLMRHRKYAGKTPEEKHYQDIFDLFIKYK